MTDAVRSLHRLRRLSAVLALTGAAGVPLVACSSSAEGASTGGAPSSASAVPAPISATGTMTISPSVERPSTPGSAENFTGSVSVTPWSEPTDAIAASTAEVAFEPGARSAWHSHPAGQTLIVTDGGGWVQARGEERRALASGDVVTTPPGVEHWHGAAAETPLTHIALTGVTDGANADWGHLVSDAEYAGTP